MSNMAPTAEFPFYSTTEAAEYLGYDNSRIRQLIRANELQATAVGGRGYAIPAAEVERLKKNPPKRGRPNKSTQ